MKQPSTASRRILLAVLAITLLGFALRLARYQQSFFGDELSTLYVTQGRSLSEVISLISSNAEITPPFYFVLAWLSQKLGSAPELVRLPSLIAGTASIPLVYLLGARLISRAAGLIAATVMALSPSMIFYSGDGRGYALLVLLLLVSTLSMLEGARSGRNRWWIVYGGVSCLAMYTHYTAAFVLLAQFAWVLWAYPEARRGAILGNVGAAVLFIPWIPSFFKDNDSPTLDVLSRLQGKSFAAKRYAVEIWSIGYPFRTPNQVPGVLAGILGLAGFVTATAASLLRLRSDPERRASLPTKNVVLVLTLLLATPVLELLVWALTGNDLFGSRNLGAATPGLALVIGMVLAGAGRLWGTICAIAVIACFGIGAARTLDTSNHLPDLKSAAEFIDSAAGPDDVVVDMLSARVTPVPLTPVDSYLSQGRPEFRLLLPEGEPPFLVTSPVPPSADLLRQAVSEAKGGQRLFVIATDEDLDREGDDVNAILAYPVIRESGSPERFPLPAGSRIVDEVEFQGIGPVNVYVIEVGGRGSA